MFTDNPSNFSLSLWKAAASIVAQKLYNSPKNSKFFSEIQHSKKFLILQLRMFSFV